MTCEKKPKDPAVDPNPDGSDPDGLDSGWPEVQRLFWDQLRLYHFPVAVKFLFSEREVEDFRREAPGYYRPVKPMTFCQWEVAARMKGQTVLGLKEDLGCLNSRFVLGWEPMGERVLKGHLKFARDRAQAERFALSKPRLPEGALRAVVVSPLAAAFFAPDSVHFFCDNIQAYHLLADWMTAMDTHPLRASILVNSSACAGNVLAYLEKTANMLPSCGGSYNAGKTERGEVNVIIPGGQIRAVAHRLAERIELHGGPSLTRPGDPFPGADVCKNCPLMVFKKDPGPERAD